MYLVINRRIEILWNKVEIRLIGMRYIIGELFIPAVLT